MATAGTLTPTSSPSNALSTVPRQADTGPRFNALSIRSSDFAPSTPYRKPRLTLPSSSSDNSSLTVPTDGAGSTEGRGSDADSANTALTRAGETALDSSTASTVFTTPSSTVSSARSPVSPEGAKELQARLARQQMNREQTSRQRQGQESNWRRSGPSKSASVVALPRESKSQTDQSSRLWRSRRPATRIFSAQNFASKVSRVRENLDLAKEQLQSDYAGLDQATRDTIVQTASTWAGNMKSRARANQKFTMNGDRFGDGRIDVSSLSREELSVVAASLFLEREAASNITNEQRGLQRHRGEWQGEKWDVTSSNAGWRIKTASSAAGPSIGSVGRTVLRSQL